MHHTHANRTQHGTSHTLRRMSRWRNVTRMLSNVLRLSNTTMSFTLGMVNSFSTMCFPTKLHPCVTSTFFAASCAQARRCGIRQQQVAPTQTICAYVMLREVHCIGLLVTGLACQVSLLRATHTHRPVSMIMIAMRSRHRALRTTTDDPGPRKARRSTMATARQTPAMIMTMVLACVMQTGRLECGWHNPRGAIITLICVCTDSLNLTQLGQAPRQCYASLLYLNLFTVSFRRNSATRFSVSRA